jgi:hypothetical protein
MFSAEKFLLEEIRKVETKQADEFVSHRPVAFSPAIIFLRGTLLLVFKYFGKDLSHRSAGRSPIKQCSKCKRLKAAEVTVFFKKNLSSIVLECAFTGYMIDLCSIRV